MLNYVKNQVVCYAEGITMAMSLKQGDKTARLGKGQHKRDGEKGK